MKSSEFRSVSILLLLCVSLANAQQVDFNIDAAQNIDLRIDSKHASINKPLFTLQNHVKHIFTRNPDCWAADLDLTCISPSNKSAGNLRAGTLVTKRHVILAAHFNLKAGDSIYFVTKENLTVGRRIIAHKVNTDFNTNLPDIEILTLDSDVPSSITPCQFLPSNYKNYIANDGDGLPVLYTDQEEKALVADVWSINSSKGFDLQVPIQSNRTALNETVITGDSGNPIFLILNGTPVIIGCFTWGGAGSGNSLSYYANLPAGGTMPEQNINDLIKATDAIVGANTGYKITLFDFVAAGIPSVITSSNKVYTTGQMLNVDLGTDILSEIQITDASGRNIKKQQISSQKFNFSLPANGLYIVRISNSLGVISRKVFAK